MAHIAIIVGSTRPGRFSEKLIPWLDSALKEKAGITHEILDLKVHVLPYFDHSANPSSVKNGEYAQPEHAAWAKKIAGADAYIVISPEYNHGYSAVLKNAFDVVYAEWNNKPIGFVAYGTVGGARAVEQLRQVAVELQMAPIRNAVHIVAPWALRDESGELKADVLDSYDHARDNMIEQLLWWTKTLKAGRDNS